MEHIYLTCKNHSCLRWHCKEIAVNSDGTYNHSRNLFFKGKLINGKIECIENEKFIEECSCPASELIAVDKL